MLDNCMQISVGKTCAKPIPVLAILCAVVLAGCGRSDSDTTKAAPPPQPVPEAYREIKPDDGIKYIARTQGEINRGGVVEEIGFHLYLVTTDGKEIEVPLVNTTVSDSRVETKDFGILKIESNVNSFTLLGTETQIKKLNAFQSHQK